MISWSLAKGSLLIGRYKWDNEEPKPPFSTSSRTKIASFDLDSTLIETKSGKLHAQDANDWRWWRDVVPHKLRKLHCNGYQVIIFTNQGRLTTSTGGEAPEVAIFKQKAETILKALDIPTIVYAACANDNYRKPRTGMWEEMLKDHLMNVDFQLSYLVGDAAGRLADHSDSDRHFCINLGINFFTPDEFFLNLPPQPLGHKFDPSWHLTTITAKTNLTCHKLGENKTLYVLVGLPGAGKTTYFRKVLEPLIYRRVNQHDLGALEDCTRAAEQFLALGNPVVVDDVNVDVETRQIWTSLARKHDVPVRALNFTTPSDLCLHNDTVRALGGEKMNPEKRAIFPRIPFRKLEARFTKPHTSEGFDEVIDIGFQWELKVLTNLVERHG